MPDTTIPEADGSAEKTYAAGTEGLFAPTVASQAEGSAGDVAVPANKAPAPTETPARARRGRKPRTPSGLVGDPAPRKVAAAKVKTVKAKVAKPDRKPARTTASNTKKTPIFPLKDKTMATTTPDFTKGIQDAIADAQDKAKVAFEKGATSLGEVTEFTRGNVEALVESGKIFAAGAQDIGSTYVADSRAAFETLTADIKELAAAKSPTDFVKVQGDLLRRNFDAAVAAGSKNSEAMLKLFNEAFAPISGRVSLAVDKVKKAA